MKKMTLAIAMLTLGMSVNVTAQEHYAIITDPTTGMKGCLNQDSVLILPFKYEQLEHIGNGYFFSVKGSKGGIVDSIGYECVPNIYGNESSLFVKYRRMWCTKDLKRGQGGVTGYSIPVGGGNVTLEKDTLGAKFGLIDFTGKTILPFVYDDTDDKLKGSLLRVSKKGKYGFIDVEKGREVVPCIYDKIHMGVVVYRLWFGQGYNLNYRQSNLIAAMKGGKWGFLNLQGQVIIPFKYDKAIDDDYDYVFQGGRAPVVRNGLVGLINEKGIEVVPPQYKWIEMRQTFYRKNSVDYPSAKMTNGKVVLLNKQNRVCTKQYDNVFACIDSFAIYKLGEKYGLIDLTTCKETTAAVYDEITEKSIGDGFIRFKKGEKYGFLDKKGHEVFTGFDSAGSFENGYCAVRGSNNKWGYIKATGGNSTFIGYEYEEAGGFSKNGIAIVKKNSKYGCISTLDRVVIPFEHEKIFNDGPDRFVIQRGEKLAIYSANGKMLCPFSSRDIIINEIHKLEAQVSTQKVNNISSKVVRDLVDRNIPQNPVSNSNTFAVIIGNEKYQEVAQVPFAENDAKIFAEYCKKTLGVPVQNVRIYENASYGTLLSAIKDIKSIAEAYSGNCSVIFYYAGHGIPNEQSKDAYLLPVDADGKQMDICYSVGNLYRELGSLGAKNVVVFLDACFSGALRGNGMLMTARSVALKAKAETPQGNMVVFSAATGDETAWPYKEKGHGMFTYFLLRKLQESKGNCSLGELGDYIKNNVSQQSVVVNRKSQTPTITPSSSVIETWKTIKLK